ncbi:hypothetical protein [Enterococcus mundtii]|uniref:hypothetical protein n=1 Tax=Enterococcus mundtii TaxID=53346 RepID=UPI000BB5506F|nr:hypothetical protein [Enterococcus mundtii]
MLDMRIEDYRIATTSDCKNIVLSRVVRDESEKIQYTENTKGEQEESTSFIGYYQTTNIDQYSHSSIKKLSIRMRYWRRTKRHRKGYCYF